MAKCSNLGTRLLVIVLLLLVVAFGFSVQTEPRKVERAVVTPLNGDSATVEQQIAHSYKSVEYIFEQSCFDCHSTDPQFPWYHSLPLVGGMLDSHASEGKEHLDLSNGYPFGGFGNQVRALRKIRNEIEEGDMPLWSYRIMHWGTAIEGARRDSVFAWIDSSLALLGSHPGPTEHSDM